MKLRTTTDNRAMKTLCLRSAGCWPPRRRRPTAPCAAAVPADASFPAPPPPAAVPAAARWERMAAICRSLDSRISFNASLYASMYRLRSACAATHHKQSGGSTTPSMPTSAAAAPERPTPKTRWWAPHKLRVRGRLHRRSHLRGGGRNLWSTVAAVQFGLRTHRPPMPAPADCNATAEAPSAHTHRAGANDPSQMHA